MCQKMKDLIEFSKKNVNHIPLLFTMKLLIMSSILELQFILNLNLAKAVTQFLKGANSNSFFLENSDLLN